MTTYVLVSAKGSPGVTTAATALAAVAASTTGGLLVELDPAGGSVQILARGSATSGLVEAAGRLRRGASRRAVMENVSTVLPGVAALTEPTAATTAEAVIRSVGNRWMPLLQQCAPMVLVDGGRWEPGRRSASRVQGADLVVVVCRPTVAGVEHARHIVDPLAETAGQKVAVIVVGSRPYAPAEVAAHLGTQLVGAMAWDPRGAAGLWAAGASRVWLRSRLARSAAATLEGLVALTGTAPALPPGEVVPNGTQERPAAPYSDGEVPA